MQTRKFGKTEMQTTLIGFGSWAIGGPGWAAGWRAQDDGEAPGAIEPSLELGVPKAVHLHQVFPGMGRERAALQQLEEVLREEGVRGFSEAPQGRCGRPLPDDAQIAEIEAFLGGLLNPREGL